MGLGLQPCLVSERALEQKVDDETVRLRWKGGRRALVGTRLENSDSVLCLGLSLVLISLV